MHVAHWRGYPNARRRVVATNTSTEARASIGSTVAHSAQVLLHAKLGWVLDEALVAKAWDGLLGTGLKLRRAK